jgi:hypothetical protein
MIVTIIIIAIAIIIIYNIFKPKKPFDPDEVSYITSPDGKRGNVVWVGPEEAKKKKLKRAYEEALKGTDKMSALQAGRDYYQSEGKYDIKTMEAMIANEINVCMK